MFSNYSSPNWLIVLLQNYNKIHINYFSYKSIILHKKHEKCSVYFIRNLPDSVQIYDKVHKYLTFYAFTDNFSSSKT